MKQSRSIGRASLLLRQAALAGLLCLFSAPGAAGDELGYSRGTLKGDPTDGQTYALADASNIAPLFPSVTGRGPGASGFSESADRSIGENTAPEPEAAPLPPGTTTWLGSISSDWNNPANWSDGVPDSTINVVVGTNSPPATVPVAGAHIKSLTVNKDGLLIWASCGGSLYIHGTMGILNGGTVNLGTCTPANQLIFINNVQINNGGDFIAGNGLIELQGASWSNNNGSSFDPGTSTILVDGTGDQTITGDITFYNLQITNNTGTIDFTGDVTVENTMIVEEGSNISSTTNLTVVGEFIDNSGTIVPIRPFITSVVTPSATTVNVIFNESIDSTTSQVASNYFINNGIGTPISAVRDSSDTRVVTLTLTSALTDGVEYEMIVNNVADDTSGNDVIADSTRKRFIAGTAAMFYSITSGNWSDASTWSLTGHSGSPSATAPGDSNHVIIGGSDVVVLDQNITNDHAVQVNTTGVLVTGTNVISGSGIFSLANGGELRIGSADGITSSGATGNIQTTTRLFSSDGIYKYTGTGSQVTGSGLPYTVRTLSVSLPTGQTLSLTQDVTTTTSFQLTSGTFSVGTRTLTLAGTVSGAGSLTSDPGGSIVYSQAASGQNVLAGTYGNLLFSGGAKTLASSGSISIYGAFSPNAASHVITGSTIRFVASGAQTVPAFAYNNLTVTGSADISLANAKTASGAFSVAGTLTVATGNTLDMQTYAITSLGSGSNAGRIRWNGSNLYIGGAGITEFYGASAATVAAGTGYGSLWFTGSGVKTISGTITVTGGNSTPGVDLQNNLTITAGGVLTVQGARLRVAGALTNNGNIYLQQ